MDGAAPQVLQNRDAIFSAKVVFGSSPAIAEFAGVLTTPGHLKRSIKGKTFLSHILHKVGCGFCVLFKTKLFDMQFLIRVPDQRYYLKFCTAQMDEFELFAANPQATLLYLVELMLI